MSPVIASPKLTEHTANLPIFPGNANLPIGPFTTKACCQSGDWRSQGGANDESDWRASRHNAGKPKGNGRLFRSDDYRWPDDRRHVSFEIAQHIVDYFVRHYCQAEE